MICGACGHENRAEARFCDGCGVPLARACARCGTELRAAARFCDGCGASAAPAPPARAPARDPRAYTPKHLAEKILASKSALEGERKQVTVLFADVKSSLELAESVDPEEWHRILDRFFQILADGVHRFEGTVNQYTGDGIMALFGAPIAHEDHAQRACYAALHLRDELRRYADTLRVERGLSFAVRLGLNSGEVVVGKIGDDLRMDYTAQGPVVGVAQRMEQLAEPGTVCVAEGTAALVAGWFELRPLGPLAVRGLGGPLRVAVLESAGPHRTRLDVLRTRGLSRFVGRTDEMATLEAALAHALEGRGQAVGIVAEAGTGKSRLCLEFSERCQARGIRVGFAHGVSHGKAIPLLPVLEFFRDYFAVSERDGAQAAREKIAGRLLLLDRGFDDCLPLFFDFLGVPDPAAPPPAVQGEARQRQLFAIVQRLVRARSAREPFVLVFEDLHWIDPASEAYLEKIIEFAAGTRTLVVTNTRPEYKSPWTGRSHAQQIALLPLSPAELDALLAELLGPEVAASGLPARIRERTGGNPFFAEEVVASLAESGALAGHKGRYRLAAPVERITIPAAVQSVLAARIDRLAEREKQVLQTAAVIGEEFRESILRAVVELPESELTEALSRLVRAELVFEEALYPEAEYAFKHPLTQGVAYGAQLAEKRARVHARVARALEEDAPERLDERAALLAHHCEAAGEVLAAARWHLRAGDWSSARNAREAVLHVRRAIALLDSAPETHEALTLGVEARASLLALTLRQPISEEEVKTLRAEASAAALRSGDARLGALVTITHRFGTTLNGLELRDAIDELGGALATATRLGDRALSIGAHCVLAAAHSRAGAFEPAIREVDRGLELFEGFQYRPPGAPYFVNRAGLFGFRSGALMRTGRLDEADRDFEENLRLATESGELTAVSLAHGSGTDLAAVHGDGPLALSRALRAREAAAETEATSPSALSDVRLGTAFLLVGDAREAAVALERGLALLQGTHTMGSEEALALGSLARAHALLGDARARDESRDAIRLLASRASSDPVGVYVERARVLRLLDGVGASGEIEASLAEGERLALARGDRAALPFVHEERAELARLLGDEAARERELREAQRLFAEIGAPLQVERLARELAP